MPKGRGIVGQPAKPELHEYIDDLFRQEVFGSVTFRFQKGILEGISENLEIKMPDIVDAYRAGDTLLKKKVLIVRRNQIQMDKIN